MAAQMIKIGNIFKKSETNTNQSLNELRKKILVIEDEIEILDLYKELLIDAGYDVSTAQNGQEGLNKIIEVSPSLIFLDLRMPVMDGKNMLTQLKNDIKYKKYSKIPVVILSNSGGVENIRDTVRLGDASEFIIKSNIKPDDIVEISKKYLG